MKKLFYLIIIISLIIPGWSNAQEFPQIQLAEIDSIKLLLNGHPDDEEKVSLLNEYARLCFYNKEPLDGLIATNEAKKLAERLNFKGGKIMYYLTLAAYKGSGAMSSYYLKQAEWLSKDPTEQLSEYYLPVQVIDFSDDNPDWEELKIEFKEIQSYFEKVDDAEILANVFSDIAFLQFQLDDFSGSLESQEKSIMLFKELGLVFPAFRVTSNKTYNLKRLGMEEEIKEQEAELIDFVTQNESDSTYGLITTSMASGYNGSGRYGLAVEYYLKGISAFKQIGDTAMLVDSYISLGSAYRNLVMYDKAAMLYEKLIPILILRNDSINLFNVYSQASFSNYYIKDYAKAREYMANSLLEPNEATRNYYLARQNSLEGQILKDQGQYATAITYLQKALTSYIEQGRRNGNPFMAMYTAECYLKMGDLPKALENAMLALEMEKATNLARTKVESELSLMLSDIYDKMGQTDKAYQHLKRYQEIRAENDNLDAANRLADAEVREILEKSQRQLDEAEQERLLTDQENKIQRVWIISIAGALLSAIILTLVLYRNNKNKQKANALLSKQKEEIEATLEKLESTQTQLIQSEKMASLGELTAGIAHEIQNPLNFVNNFSEVSSELVKEIQDERRKTKDQRDEELTDEILNDIEQNLGKVNHHGQRASDIVKSMLEHSRQGDGLKEPTDINKLADEYLRLAYHGIRAKDKSFNADFELDLDESLPNVNVIPQDIGRVLLNLINNAFYAVREVETPLVKVSTEASPSGNGVEICVTDNGLGIPDDIKDKIFQPFFTTKATGEGTGLGLSMSYDIVTKGHGGKIEVESETGKGTKFIIELPVRPETNHNT